MDPKTLVFERIFDVPVKKVWKALIDKNEMKQWYFDLAEFKAEVGFTFRFTGGPSPEKQYVHICEVTEVSPEKKLAYSWRYEGYSGNSLVRFELTSQGSKTLLRLTHEGIQTFPRDNSDFAIGNFEEGWNSILHQSLKSYLEN